VLDLGCGPGPLARRFASLAREVMAIDPTPEMLTAARALAAGTTNIHFLAGSSYDSARPLAISTWLSWAARSIGWTGWTRSSGSTG
jgi:Methylase involved in ubiquinone/menaquinone biosynthesis